jgi:hypothetical protein
MRQLAVAVFGHLAVPAIGQHPDGLRQELPPPRPFPPVLFLFGGDPDGRQFILIASHKTGQAQAQRPGIELVRFALAVEGDGRDEKTLRPGRDQFAVQRETEAATFLHAENLEPLGHPLPDLLEELLPRELARGQGRGVIALGHGHDELQMHVQAELQRGLGGIVNRTWQRLVRRYVYRLVWAGNRS